MVKDCTFLDSVGFWCICMQKCYYDTNTTGPHDRSTNIEVNTVFVTNNWEFKGYSSASESSRSFGMFYAKETSFMELQHWF